MFPKLESLEDFPSILHAERESHSEDSYRWDNLNREPEGTIVIQRTIRGEAIFEDAGGQRIAGPDRTMVFIYGDRNRYRIGPPETRPYELEYIVFGRQGGIGDLVRQLRKDFGSILHMEAEGEAGRIMQSIVEKFRNRASWDHIGLAELAYRLILAIYREQISGTRGHDPVTYLRHLLQSRYRSPRNLKEWVNGLPMSREHVSRVFRERYGESPASYLRGLRLGHARLLARTSPMTADEIAAACGFTSTQTLRRAYRRSFGHSIGSAPLKDK